MLDSLAALKSRTKAQIAAARRNFDSTPSQPSVRVNAESLRREAIERNLENERLRRRDEIEREVQRAESILPSAPLDDYLTKEVNSQLTDSWARIVSEFKRQLDSSSDLRVLIADEELLEEQPTDHATVKFFKGVLSEWRIRLFSLTDEELQLRKPELTTMWYCLFALQPLFSGLNRRDLSRDVSIETGAIANELKKLNFKGALDHYNNLAIGNSLWPIGITQYSIHWKFSCDLIDSERMLHLFNNEPARNAIVSIKRLMTKYQEFHERIP
jgi:pre-mRNA-splicing factor 18